MGAAFYYSIAGALSSSGWDVERERLYHMPSDQGKKPNIVAAKPDQSCIILDVQVVNGSLDMEQTWRAKIRKYDRNDLRQAVSELKGVAPNNIRVMAATLSWRGVWCGKSATELRELGISVGVLRGITTRVLLGSYLNWWSFYRGTSLHPSLPPPPSSSSLIPRAGVGWVLGVLPIIFDLLIYCFRVYQGSGSFVFTFQGRKKKFSKIKIFTRVLRFRPFWTILVPCLSVCVSVMNSL